MAKIEVTPIRGSSQINDRPAEIVAEEIRQYYERIASLGGKIVGSHAIGEEQQVWMPGHLSGSTSSFIGREVLYLVASLPAEDELRDAYAEAAEILGKN